MSLPIEPPRLPEIQEMFRASQNFCAPNFSKISEMLSFLHYKKTTPKQRGLLLIIFIFKYLVYNHYLLESHCADLHSETVDSLLEFLEFQYYRLF